MANLRYLSRFVIVSLLCASILFVIVPAAFAESPETPARKLLDKLKEQNAGNDRYKDSWCRTLKEIADLGPDAVPELIEELDATDNEMMLRCLGFLLRAINDKRAVPALIRAIPKTLIRPSSDMGLVAADPDLIKFAQANDLDRDDAGGEYGFGRPVLEIFGAIHKLTGHELNDDELYSIFQVGLPSQQQLKRELFQRRTIAWAEWWEQNWSKHLQDEDYSQVNLIIPEDEGGIEPPQLDGEFRTSRGGSNWLLESVYDPNAKRVFYDLDIGRVGALPKKWREAENVDANLEEILKWAMREGFDLMGTEVETRESGKVYALRSLAMRVWELDQVRWKADFQNVTLDDLKEEGRIADKLLFARDGETLKPKSKAPFFYITRHGTPGLLFVGIPVDDDSLKPGGRWQGDHELNPISFKKGRRFAFTYFEEEKR